MKEDLCPRSPITEKFRIFTSVRFWSSKATAEKFNYIYNFSLSRKAVTQVHFISK